MIPVDDLLYGFELRQNEISREDNQNIPLEDKLILLNDAQITWCKQKIGLNNIYKIGYEGNLKRIEDLQFLKTKSNPIPAIKTSNIRYLSYEIQLPKRLMYISSFSEAKKGKCNTTIFNNLIREDEVERKYFDVNYTPSFEWVETTCTEENDKLILYTDGSFEIQNVHVTYLRYPKNIDKEGYLHFDGSPSINQECELPEYAKQDIIDIAVLLASQATKDQQTQQATIQRIQINE